MIETKIIIYQIIILTWGALAVTLKKLNTERVLTLIAIILFIIWAPLLYNEDLARFHTIKQ